MADEQIITHRNEDQRKDSIEIGTAGKGGALKVYFDAHAPLDETKQLIITAKLALDFARDCLEVRA